MQDGHRSVIVSAHAVERIGERVGISADEMAAEIEKGNAVRLKGGSKAPDGGPTRSGHLLYVPALEQFFLAVMEDRNRTVVTVLAARMSTTDRWMAQITPDNMARARHKYSKGNSAAFLRAKAEYAGSITMKLIVHSLDSDYKKVRIQLLRTEVGAWQVDEAAREVVLTDAQISAVITAFEAAIQAGTIRRCGDLLASTGAGKKLFVRLQIPGVPGLAEAERAAHWLDRGDTPM